MDLRCWRCLRRERVSSLVPQDRGDRHRSFYVPCLFQSETETSQHPSFPHRAGGRARTQVVPMVKQHAAQVSCPAGPGLSVLHPCFPLPETSLSVRWGAWGRGTGPQAQLHVASALNAGDRTSWGHNMAPASQKGRASVYPYQSQVSSPAGPGSPIPGDSPPEAIGGDHLLLRTFLSLEVFRVTVTHYAAPAPPGGPRLGLSRDQQLSRQPRGRSAGL